MSVAATPASLYARAQDSALSEAGIELRDSLEAALEPSRSGRLGTMFKSVTAAFRKGVSSENFTVSAEVLGRTLDVLCAIPDSFPVPEIVVESDREVGLDWHEGARRTLSITIDETSTLGFAALVGHEPVYGHTPFDGTIPETIQYLLRRLYPDSAS